MLKRLLFIGSFGFLPVAAMAAAPTDNAVQLTNINIGQGAPLTVVVPATNNVTAPYALTGETGRDTQRPLRQVTAGQGGSIGVLAD